MNEVGKIVLTSPEGEVTEMTVKDYVNTKSSDWIYLSTSNKVDYYNIVGEKMKVGKAIIYLGKKKRKHLDSMGIKY